MTCRKLWITIVAFGVVGIGAALGLVPIFSDMLNTARCLPCQLYSVLHVLMALLAHRSAHEDEDSLALTAVISGIDSSTLSLG